MVVMGKNKNQKTSAFIHEIAVALPNIKTKEELLNLISISEKELETVYGSLWKQYEQMEALEAYYKDQGITEYQYKADHVLLDMRNILDQLKRFVYLKESPEEKREKLKKKIESDLDSIDYFFSKEVSNLFSNYFTSDSVRKRISILNELRHLYMKDNCSLSKQKKDKMQQLHRKVAHLYHIDLNSSKGKKELHEILKRKEFFPIRMMMEDMSKRTRKGAKCIHAIDRLLTIEKSIPTDDCFTENKEPDDVLCDLPFAKEDLFSKKFLAFLTDLRSSQFLGKYSSQLLTETPHEVEEIFDDLKTLDQESLIMYATFAKGIIRNRRRVMQYGLFEGMDIELSFLQRIEKMFQDLIPVQEIKEEEIDYSAYYDIIMPLLEDDRNFIYIKHLLESNPNFVKARKEEHILIPLLDLFIYNYKLKLVDQGFTYLDPTFYKEVICCYFQHGASLTKEEEQLFLTRMKEFEEYIQARKYYHSVDVLNDLSCIFTSINGVTSKEVEKEEKIKQSEYINFYSLRSKVYDYKMEGKKLFWNHDMETFGIEGIPNFAFSIQTLEDGEERLSIHLLDTSEFIDSKSELALEMKKGRKLNIFLKPELEYPCRTFTYQFSLDGKIDDVRISSSVVTFDQVYTEEEIDSYRTNPTLKQLFGMFHRINELKDEKIPYHRVEEIEQFVSHFVGGSIIDLFQRKNIPFIYEKQLKEEEELVLSNYNKVCSLLFKLPKKEAHQVFETLTSQEEAYYITHFEPDERIELDGNTYLGLLLLEHLQKMEKKRFDKEVESKTIRAIQKELNNQRGYLPNSYFVSEMKEKEKRKEKKPAEKIKTYHK